MVEAKGGKPSWTQSAIMVSFATFALKIFL
jgi:hypothetical protein